MREPCWWPGCALYSYHGGPCLDKDGAPRFQTAPTDIIGASELRLHRLWPLVRQALTPELGLTFAEAAPLLSAAVLLQRKHCGRKSLRAIKEAFGQRGFAIEDGPRCEECGWLAPWHQRSCSQHRPQKRHHADLGASRRFLRLGNSEDRIVSCLDGGRLIIGRDSGSGTPLRVTFDLSYFEARAVATHVLELVKLAKLQAVSSEVAR